jgi:hypothetical protein
MTEEEAKRKWCPAIRFLIGPETSTWKGVAYTNRCQELEPSACLCIASECMMWRKEKALYGDDYGKDIPDDRGYCGMGGQP